MGDPEESRTPETDSAASGSLVAPGSPMLGHDNTILDIALSRKK